jgi:hypothetical protein
MAANTDYQTFNRDYGWVMWLVLGVISLTALIMSIYIVATGENSAIVRPPLGDTLTDSIRTLGGVDVGTNLNVEGNVTSTGDIIAPNLNNCILEFAGTINGDDVGTRFNFFNCGANSLAAQQTLIPSARNANMCPINGVTSILRYTKANPSVCKLTIIYVTPGEETASEDVTLTGLERGHVNLTPHPLTVDSHVYIHHNGDTANWTGEAAFKLLVTPNSNHLNVPL